MGKIIKIGLSLFIIGIIGTAALVFTGTGFGSERIMEKQTFNGKTLKNVSIHSDNANVVLHPADDDKIKVELKGKTDQKLKTKFQVSDNGETINIFVKQKNKLFNFDFMNRHDVDLYVYLPQKVYDLLEVQTNIGDISTDDTLTAKNANIKTEMGEIHLNGFEGKKIVGKSALGDIEIKDLHAAFDIQTDKGDVKLQPLLAPDNQNITKSALGDVYVEIGNHPKGIALDLSTKLGDIKSDFPITTVIKDSSDDIISQNLKGQYGKKIKNSPSLTIQTDAGDITLKK